MSPDDIDSREVEFDAPDARIRGVRVCMPGCDARPGIVLIPDVHGVSPLYRELAARLVREGFVVLVIDLYSREGAPKLADAAAAMRFIATLPDERVLGDLAAAVRFLREDAQVEGKPVGITGFCMGGQYALLAACTDAEIAACVSFYGMVRYREHNALKPRGPLDVAESLAGPYLGIFGAEDALIPNEDVEELRRRLGKANKRFEVISYPGCGHAFLNSTRADAYRPEAAADAFQRATAFFRRELGE